MVLKCGTLLLALLSICHLQATLAEKQVPFLGVQGKNWFQANEYFHRLGMRLAIIDSQAKHQMLVSEAKTTQAHPQAYFGGWLGASDLGLYGTFIWHGTGDRMVFSKWKIGEPSGLDEHCVVLHYWQDLEFYWTWNDGHCTTELTAICERIESVSCIEQFK